MTFTQVITVEGAEEQALRELMAGWDEEQSGVAPGYQGSRILADEESDQCMIVVDFSSEDEARRNNERDATRQWAERLRELAEGEPTYRNTREVDSTYN